MKTTTAKFRAIFALTAACAMAITSVHGSTFKIN